MTNDEVIYTLNCEIDYKTKRIKDSCQIAIQAIEDNTKLKDAIKKIKEEIKNEDLYDDEGVLRSQVTQTWKVLKIIDKYTEGLT